MSYSNLIMLSDSLLEIFLFMFDLQKEFLGNRTSEALVHSEVHERFYLTKVWQ